MENDAKPFKELLRVVQVARQLNLSRSAIYQLMDAGKLPYVKIGRSRRVRPEDVLQLIEQSKVG